MRVRVCYTETFSDGDMKALTRYYGRRPSRSELRQNLEDLGRMGVEEQVSDGQVHLDNEPLPLRARPASQGAA